MPHSPRLHNGELWVLNSGTGELGVVAFNKAGKGTFSPRVFTNLCQHSRYMVLDRPFRSIQNFDNFKNF